MFSSFYDQKTPSWNSELKEINLGNTRPRKKVYIEDLKATNRYLLTLFMFVMQEIKTHGLTFEPELRTSNGVFRTCKSSASW